MFESSSQISQISQMSQITGVFQLCYRSLFHSGRGFAFPCDSQGNVRLDELSERARNNYLFARAMVGRELALPAIEPALAY